MSKNNFCICIALILFSISCGKKEDSTNSGTSDACLSNPPEVPAAAGQLAFTLPADIDRCNVGGYIVGYKDQLKIASANDGKYYITNVPAGEQDVIITAGSLAIGLLSEKAKDRGVRLKKQKFLNGVKNEPGEIAVPKFGSLTGVANLIGQTDHAGIDVYVPGTDMIAKTDVDGKFSISYVPVGEHNLFFEKDGYHRGQAERIIVKEAEATIIPKIDLVISTGAEGFILIENGTPSVRSRVAKLTIGATPNAVLVKISESNTFEGASWKPLVTSTYYTFPTAGQKTLYVIFADSNGLQSSPFSASIVVNLFEDVSPLAVTPSLVVPPNPPNFTLSTVSIPENAIWMRLSISSDFAGAEWIKATLTTPFVMQQSQSVCGTHSLYLQYKDKDDFLSPTLSTVVEVQCWWPVSTTNSPSLSRLTSNYNAAAVAIDTGIFFYGPGNQAGQTQAYLYNPSSSTWTQVADAPIALMGAVAVWTGQKVMVWGGYLNGDPFLMNQNILVYTPNLNSWETVTPTNTIPGRAQAGAVWTGSKMIVWGGDQSQVSPGARNDGGSYDPNTNSWTLLSTLGAPTARDAPTMAWTGSKMVVWGGNAFGNSGAFSTGGAYDPANDTWSPIASSPLSMTYSYLGVWTGKNIIVPYFTNGGSDAPLGFLSYDPSSNTWKTFASTNIPFSQGGPMVTSWFNGKMLIMNALSAKMLLPIVYQ